MIAWVNGAFGSGKTTLANALRPHWPEALMYDPEQVGYLLREIVPVPTGDFQDLPLWRRQVVDLAVGLVAEYRRPLLVPMTLVDPGYHAEIFDGLRDRGLDVHHFFLKVSPQVLTERIDSRVHAPDDPEQEAEIRSWCKGKIAQCVAAADSLPGDTVFLDGELPIGELVDQVLARVRTGNDGDR
ncbi:AAA family ATPase [Streptomyces sp. NPDC047315]|uniref:AAA family ATPase n=1 Tax=Streptomyces sp. NPDC047315 TaxID=3155142 RepID=UPI0033E6C74F